MPRWELAWEVDETSFARAFNVYTREAGTDDPWVREGSTDGYKFVVEIADGTPTIEAAVAPIVGGIEAAETTWAVLSFNPQSFEDIPLPPDVASLTGEQIDESFDVRLRFPPVSDPHLRGYEVREGASWEAGLKRAFVPAGDTGGRVEVTFGIMASTETTYMVKALSTHGRYSDTEASTTLDIQAPSGWVTDTETTESTTFGGTKTDMEVVSGDLQVTEETGVIDAYDTGVIDDYDTWAIEYPHRGSGTYQTDAVEATDDTGAGLVVDAVIEVEMGYSLTDPVTLTIDDLTAPMAPELIGDVAQEIDAVGPYDRVNIDDELLDGVDVLIEIDTTPDDPASSPMWDGWREWIPGARYRYRGVRLRFTFTLYWFSNVTVDTLVWRQKRKNLKDEGEEDIDMTGGWDITFDQPFTQAPFLTFGALQMGKEAIAVPGTFSRTGVTLKVYDTTTGNETTGVVHWIAAGV